MSDDILLDVAQLSKDLAIDPTNLSKCMIDQLGYFVHYCGIAIKARRALDEAKNRQDLIEAKLKKECRKRFIDEGTKFTEAQIDAEVKTTMEFVNAQRRVVSLTEIRDMAVVAREAFEQRKYLLLQLSKDASVESAGTLKVSAASLEEKKARYLSRKEASHD